MRNSRDYVQRELLRFQEMRQKYFEELDGLPEGHLEAGDINGNRYYTLSLDGKRAYLGRGQMPVVQGIQKRYLLEKSILILDKDIKLMKDYVKKYSSPYGDDLIKRLPKAYKPESVLNSVAINCTDSDKWERSQYVRSGRNPEGLKHRTIKGDMVRSKSEVLIANMLFTKNIPYHYEEELPLSGKIIAPDFKIAVCSENRFKLLEHCGMMGNDQYCASFTWKLQMYIRNGYLPWKDVFFTFEDLDGNIDTKLIDEMIENYFL